ncbi:MAG TPA: YdcF family protein [Deltaproteobacteria bacterium]|nr:YdcF family protein [Deltaproteobacteria bacterium]
MGAALVLVGLRIGWIAVSISWVGAFDRAVPSDVVIVLGAAVSGGQPSPVFAARLDHGVELWKRGIAPALILTGGIGDGDTLAESEVGRSYVLAQGVPATQVQIETWSRTTHENLIGAQQLMQAQGWSSAVLVSDPLHLYRASRVARGLGIDATTSPTPGSRYRSLRTQIPFLLREIYFVHHHQLLGR